MRKLDCFIVFLLCVATMSCSFIFSEEHVTIDNPNETKVTETTIAEATVAPTTVQPTAAETTDSSFNITLSFVGDMLCATNEGMYYENCFEEVASKKKPSYFLKKVSKYFKSDDFTIADCENVYSDSENLQVSDKGQYDNPGIEAYWFKTKAKNAKILSAGGIDMVSIDNNHINDYGTQGYSDTKEALTAANVQWGEAGKIVYFEKNNFKLAIICTTMYSNYTLDSIIDYIKEAEKQSDYQIVYFHGGTEAVHEPEQWKIDSCHKMIDKGADLVMGDHPHVLQPMENYKGKTIIYSLGNFVFGGNRHPENRTIIYQHTLNVSKDNKLLKDNGSIIPCYVYTGSTNNWQPAPITNKSDKKKVLDFMNSKRKSPL